MKLEKSLWIRALRLERNQKAIGEDISRKILQDAFQIPESEARGIIYALENRDTIRLSEDPIGTENGETCLVMNDLHIPFQDKLSLETVLDYAEKIQPNKIILNGDIIDFYQISRYVRNPSKKSVGQEIKEVKDFLTDLRKRFPVAEIIYTEGNHEKRLEDFIYKNATQISDLIGDLLSTKLGFDQLNIKYEVGPYKIGKLTVIHGHEMPGGSYQPEYVTNVIWNYIYSNFIVAHFHRNQTKTWKNIHNELFWGGAIGYLAGEMEYAKLNKWNQGFGIINFRSNGAFQAEVKAIHEGNLY